MSNNKDLVRIIDLYEIRVDGNRKARLANLNVIGELSPGLPLAEDLIKQYLEDPWSLAGKSIICAARLSDQYGSPKYNRTEEIDLNKCEQNLGEKSGYSYQSANVGSGWVRPYGKEIANTQSGHRCTMRYAVELDPDARTVLNLSFHNPDHSYDEMIQIESDDHHTDCADRKNQTGLDKFKSAYYGGRDWAVQLYVYCKPFNISIAGTLEGAYFSLPSHSYLSTALSVAGKGNVDTYLTSFTKYKCEKTIQASCVVAGSLFLKQFAPQITKVNQDNNVDSFDLMMKWWFKDYGPLYAELDPDKRCCTQLDLIQGGGLYKGNEPTIARFVYLYNDFVRLRARTDGWKISGRNSTAIPFQGSEKDKESGWNNFLSKANHLIKPVLGSIATTPFF